MTALVTKFSAVSVDTKAAIIPGVSVITSGKAIGHDFTIDATTLEQVRACSAAFPDGVRVKIEHGTGFESIVGVLKNFRIDDDQLRGDLHLIESHAQTPAILEMAEKFPGSFGLSISFSGVSDKSGAARCTELYSVDLVDYPAANPNGLFSARVDSKTITASKVDMTTEEIAKANETGFLSALKNFFGKPEDALALTGKLSTAETNLTAAQTEITNLKATITQNASDLATVKLSVTSLTAERDTLKAQVDKAIADLKTKGSHDAATILATLGVPPVEVKTTDAKDEKLTARAEALQLKGLAKVIALEKIESAERAPRK
jgi:hypothetical protein